MKKLYFTFMLVCVALGSMAQTVGDAMFVYRNNGQVNGFLPDEIESIEYSYEDADGVRYDEIVTQIVNTADSVYMIPLAEIDSITFVTPETEYMPGVINISDQLMPYVASSDGLTIVFDSSTPPAIMPRVGDKLVTLEMNEQFPAGFAGEVVSVSGSQVECQLVTLEEIFETYSGVSSVYGYQQGANAHTHKLRRAVSAFGNKDFRLGTFTWSKSAELGLNIFGSDNLALKGGTQLSIGITPSFHVISTLIINKDEGTYFSSCITGDISLQEQISVYGGIEWSKDFLDKEWVRVPVAPLTFFYVKPGLFFRASATVSMSAVWTQCYTMGAAFDFSTKNRSVLKPTCGGRLASSSFDIEGALDGSIAVGGFMEIGLSVLSSDIDNLCFCGELGAELVGHAVLYNSDIAEAVKDTKVYERFKNSNIDVNAFVNTSVQAECGPWGISYSLPWNLSYNLKTWDVVPTFSNTKFRQKPGGQTSADASATMSGDCLIPVMVGLSVRDEYGNEVDDYYSSFKFDNGSWPLITTFSNLPDKGELTLHPKVRIFGYEMLASPSVWLERTEMPVVITNFKQTGSNYLKDGYSNNGKTYSYKYDCSVTVELTDSKNVEDWGYVYEDIDGQIKRLSLRSYGSPYTDTRYSYYRNESNSTVCLYGYVKYSGDSEYYYGEQEDYKVSYSVTSCPDENHPHQIDLGLPSGTKWACCNVGAQKPEDYGDYFAWGETNTKSVYTEAAYSYIIGQDTDGDGWIDNYHVVNIGSDIQGTQYDAATANWGSPWVMPNKEQKNELCDNCTNEWTTENGVKGRRFTGSNGASIFFPAAGTRYEDDLYDLGVWGRYWLSTRFCESCAGDEFGFHDGFQTIWQVTENWLGQSVRPVRKN